MEQNLPDTNQPIETIIEGSEYLSYGQGFFEQQPFEVTIKALKTDGIDPNIFTRVIAGRARDYYIFLMNKDLHKDLIDPEFDTDTPQGQRDMKLIRRIKKSGAESQDAFKILRAIKQLEEFPLVLDYIEAKRSDLYDITGKYKLNISQELFLKQRPRSYASWLEKQNAAAVREISHGIEEVFPDQNPMTSGRTINGVREQNRRWKILKKADLVR